MSESGDKPVVVLLEPTTAAQRLGISASGLRRLAPIYESVFEELPRKGSGAENKRAYLWPEEAVERLQSARQLVELERYKTISDALSAIKRGVTVETVDLEPADRQTILDKATQQTLELLLKEMTALRREVQELKQGRELEKENPAKIEERPHGLLVRLALRVEAWLRR